MLPSNNSAITIVVYNNLYYMDIRVVAETKTLADWYEWRTIPVCNSKACNTRNMPLRRPIKSKQNGRLVFTSHTCEILLLSHEHKIHIFSPPCNIPFILTIALPTINQHKSILRIQPFRKLHFFTWVINSIIKNI